MHAFHVSDVTAFVVALTGLIRVIIELRKVQRKKKTNGNTTHKRPGDRS